MYRYKVGGRGDAALRHGRACHSVMMKNAVAALSSPSLNGWGIPKRGLCENHDCQKSFEQPGSGASAPTKIRGETRQAMFFIITYRVQRKINLLKRQSFLSKKRKKRPQRESNGLQKPLATQPCSGFPARAASVYIHLMRRKYL